MQLMGPVVHSRDTACSASTRIHTSSFRSSGTACDSPTPIFHFSSNCALPVQSLAICSTKRYSQLACSCIQHVCTGLSPNLRLLSVNARLHSTTLFPAGAAHTTIEKNGSDAGKRETKRKEEKKAMQAKHVESKTKRRNVCRVAPELWRNPQLHSCQRVITHLFFSHAPSSTQTFLFFFVFLCTWIPCFDPLPMPGLVELLAFST